MRVEGGGAKGEEKAESAHSIEVDRLIASVKEIASLHLNISDILGKKVYKRAF